MQYEMVIELRGLIRADSMEAAMGIAKEQAKFLADELHLGDYLIDETEAMRVIPAPSMVEEDL